MRWLTSPCTLTVFCVVSLTVILVMMIWVDILPQRRLYGNISINSTSHQWTARSPAEHNKTAVVPSSHSASHQWTVCSPPEENKTAFVPSKYRALSSTQADQLIGYSPHSGKEIVRIYVN